MKTAAALSLMLLVLAACDVGQTASAPQTPPKAEPAKSGITVSGYARTGVSTSF